MNKVVIANWKTNPQSLKDADIIVNGIIDKIKNNKKINFVICPPLPFLSILKNFKIKNLFLGAQDVSSFLNNSYTGEVSAKILANFNVKYVIVGHSEMRTLGETDKTINEKILVLLKSKITPILCVGERFRDRNGEYLSFIKNQLVEDLLNVPKSQLKNIIIAYEPLWAVGKDSIRPATGDEFIEAKIFIKKILSDIYDSKIINEINIVYGGSVNDKNAKEFMDSADAGGLLVGRDSLIPKKFNTIIDNIK